MLPTAELIHHTPTRMRVRVPSQRGQPEYFDRLVAALARLPALERIEANPVTGSVLLMPPIDVGLLARHASETGMFTLATGAAAGSDAVPLAQALAREFGKFNEQVRSVSGGGLDLASVGFLAFVTAALVQLQRGHVLGPASTLLWSAVSLLRISYDRTKPPGNS